jgi:hypothetical protein
VRSLKAQKSARRHKRRAPSALRPDARRTRNADPVGLEYLAYLKTLPCCVCAAGEISQFGETEAAHIGGNAAAKASNRSAIPLCAEHHRTGPYAQERLKARFGAFWGIDVAELIHVFNQQWEALCRLR